MTLSSLCSCPSHGSHLASHTDVTILVFHFKLMNQVHATQGLSQVEANWHKSTARLGPCLVVNAVLF